MKKTIVFAILILLLVVGCAKESGDELLAQSIIDYNEGKYDDLPATGELKDGVREIEIKAYQYYWSPELIIVDKGEKIRLKISTNDVPHGFEIEGYMIPDYDFNTKIEKDNPLTIEFTAEKSGVWEFLCSIYCGAGHGHMKGVFVIR